MDDDRSWLKDPIFPRPPAVPRFSRAELRLVDERPSSTMRVALRKAPATETRGRVMRVSGTTVTTNSSSESEIPRSRRLA